MLDLVQVHGHGQCSHCGANVEPCCTGSGRGDATTLAESPPVHQEVEPGLLLRLFATLGGEGATVTSQALEQAYVTRQGGDLQEARDVIAAALHVGKLVQSGPGFLRLA